MHGSQDTGEKHIGPYNDSKGQEESGHHGFKSHFFYLTRKKISNRSSLKDGREREDS